MRVRRVSADGDMVFGGNQRAFHRDTPDAVAQIVESRLNLWTDDWYLDRDEGTPYRTEILGKRTEALRDPAIRTRILDTPGVTEIVAYSSVLDRNDRQFAVSAQIDTQYGRSALRFPIAAQSEGLIDVREGR